MQLFWLRGVYGHCAVSACGHYGSRPVWFGGCSRRAICERSLKQHSPAIAHKLSGDSGNVSRFWASPTFSTYTSRSCEDRQCHTSHTIPIPAFYFHGQGLIRARLSLSSGSHNGLCRWLLLGRFGAAGTRGPAGSLHLWSGSVRGPFQRGVNSEHMSSSKLVFTSHIFLVLQAWCFQCSLSSARHWVLTLDSWATGYCCDCLR